MAVASVHRNRMRNRCQILHNHRKTLWIFLVLSYHVTVATCFSLGRHHASIRLQSRSVTRLAASERVVPTEVPGKDDEQQQQQPDTANGLPKHTSVQSPAGPLWDVQVDDDLTHMLPHKGNSRKRVLVLCTGGTLTMVSSVFFG